MKEFINQSERFIDEMLYGLYAAYPSYYTYVSEDAHCLIAKHKIAGRVGIATGGGSGHLPLFLGHVGKGMLDGCGIDDVFQLPSSEQMFDVTRAIDSGAGILHTFGDYNGDIFNFQMAAGMAEIEEDIKVCLSIADEDMTSGPRAKGQEKNIRQGVAGIFFVYKCADAAAAEVLPPDEMYRITEKTKLFVAAMGVASNSCTIPRIGHPGFMITDDKMEIGMGVHGEVGFRRRKIYSADDIVKEIVPPVMQDLQLRHDDEVCILINSLGATPLEGQYLIIGLVHRLLKDAGIRVHRTYVGGYATSLEVAGLSTSLLRVDEELRRLMDAAADTPIFK